MTIKIERDALLCVLSNGPLQPPLQAQQAPGVDKPIGDDSSSLPCAWVVSTGDSVPNLRIPTVEKTESFDDDCTVSTAASSLSSDSLELDERRVTFAEPLVTDVRTRPRTKREEVPNLFYSCGETARFRQEYRLERKLLAELDVDPATHPIDDEDLSLLLDSQACNRHRISRVVVMHNDKLETFFNPDTLSLKSITAKCDAGDDFFDNDSFWSGSITWY